MNSGSAGIVRTSMAMEVHAPQPTFFHNYTTVLGYFGLTSSLADSIALEMDAPMAHTWMVWNWML